MRRGNRGRFPLHADELRSQMPSRRSYIKWSNLKDRDLAMSLTLCEKELATTEGAVRSSNEWRSRWKQQQNLPLPPPTPRFPADDPSTVELLKLRSTIENTGTLDKQCLADRQQEQSLPKDPPKGALYLGTEAYQRTAEFAALGVTHRLSCLMSSQEEAEWMAYAGGAAGATPPKLAFSTSQDASGIMVARSPMADEDAFSSTDAALLMLNEGAAFIDAALQSGGVVYVHCSQGVSRSPTMVLYYLLRCRHTPLLEAVQLVKAKRVKVSPTDGFVGLLLREEERWLQTASDAALVFSTLRKKWLEDFKAGRVKLSHADKIL